MWTSRLRKAKAKQVEKSQGDAETNIGTSSGIDHGSSTTAMEMNEVSAPIVVPDSLEPGPVPRYTIDLSLPPRDRYTALATAYKHKLVQLPSLFDDLSADLKEYYWFLRPWFIKGLARLVLRRVHDHEQMEEIIGIQKVTGIPMYLLIAFNVLLDLLVGCTSGGVRVFETGDGSSMKSRNGPRKMLHFRTLDWAMDPLREIVVQLDFVAHAGGPVLASSVTYLGFVGVLTAVRPNLSISFNFRSNETAYRSLSRLNRLRYLGGKVLVLLGRRPSIPSTLRRYMIPATHREDDWHYSVIGSTLPCMDEICDVFPRLYTAQCFVIVCNGDETTVIEKDWRTAVLRSDAAFIACTNHDESEEASDDTPDPGAETSRKEHIPSSAAVTGMEEILSESVNRKHSIEKKWDRAKASYIRRNADLSEDKAAVRFAAVKRWMSEAPVSEYCTHFGVIMDAKAGKVVWSERYPEPEYDYWAEGRDVPADRWSN